MRTTSWAGGASSVHDVDDGRENAPQVRTDTTHDMQIGMNEVVSLIRWGIDEACRFAGVGVEDIRCAFLGVPGFGESASDAEQIEERLGAFLRTNFRCGNGVEAGWAGSPACRPGINLVCDLARSACWRCPVCPVPGQFRSGIPSRCGGKTKKSRSPRRAGQPQSAGFLDEAKRQTDRCRLERRSVLVWLMSRWIDVAQGCSLPAQAGLAAVAAYQTEGAMVNIILIHSAV